MDGAASLRTGGATNGASEPVNGKLTDAVSLVSHELRTPLTLIKGYVATLLHLPDLTDEERQHYLRGIEQANTRLTHLVDSILDMSTIEAGRLTLHYADDYLDSLARRVVRQMQAQTSEHMLRVSSPVPLPALRFDAGRTEQVLVNLLGNAIKYAPQGGLIEVSLGVVNDWTDVVRAWPGAMLPPGGPLQYVQVRDQGSGLLEDDLPRLFDRFHRGGSREHRAVRGAGIGLYICRAIVEAHGGAIWAENRAEGGSCFTFCLPTLPAGSS